MGDYTREEEVASITHKGLCTHFSEQPYKIHIGGVQEDCSTMWSKLLKDHCPKSEEEKALADYGEKNWGNLRFNGEKHEVAVANSHKVGTCKAKPNVAIQFPRIEEICNSKKHFEACVMYPISMTFHFCEWHDITEENEVAGGARASKPKRMAGRHARVEALLSRINKFARNL